MQILWPVCEHYFKFLILQTLVELLIFIQWSHCFHWDCLCSSRKVQVCNSYQCPCNLASSDKAQLLLALLCAGNQNIVGAPGEHVLWLVACPFCHVCIAAVTYARYNKPEQVCYYVLQVDLDVREREREKAHMGARKHRVSSCSYWSRDNSCPQTQPPVWS